MAEYQLVMRVGPSPGKNYQLTLNEIIIGRDISCDIVINDGEISRNHCKLVLQGDSYWAEDLGSTNGTFVNDRRISGKHPLKPGEMVRFGDNVTLSYERVGGDPDATLASSREEMPPPPTQRKPARQAPPPAQPRAAAPARSAPAKPAGKLNSKTIMIGCGALLVIGICITVALLLWVDAGGAERWCDVLGWTGIPYCP